jgi:FixJ family two-component response regulator
MTPVTGLPVIAIVDDDASVRRSLGRLVRSAGYAVEVFASAHAFLEWLVHAKAACLVLDLSMDEMTGFELQERLTVPIVFMTSRHDDATRARLEGSGAAAHLWKPFEGRAMLDAIRRAVGREPGTTGPGLPHMLDEGPMSTDVPSP